jgi:hypothetical protein
MGNTIPVRAVDQAAMNKNAVTLVNDRRVTPNKSIILVLRTLTGLVTIRKSQQRKSPAIHWAVLRGVNVFANRK